MILKSIIKNPLDGPKKPWKPWYGYLFLVIGVVCLGLYGYERINGGPLVPTMAVPSQVYANAKAALEHQQQAIIASGATASQDSALQDVARAAAASINASGASSTPLPAAMTLAVPFMTQSPSGAWDDASVLRSEEASALMMQEYYAGTAENLSATDAEAALVAAGDLAFDDLVAFLPGKKVDGVTIETIQASLAKGNPVIVLVDKTQLENPYFLNDGVTDHAILIRGYTETEFVTNDPGTKHGEGYTYDQQLIMSALLNTAMITK